MLIKSDLATANSSVTMPVATSCGNCGVEERRLLHHIRHRGMFRRLCTTCVLRLNPQSFCPTCFQVYPPLPPNDVVLTCIKCYSSSHGHCVAAGPMSPPSPYICPLCVHPNTPIFKLKTAKEANLETNETMTFKSENCRVMDKDAARKLLAAAKIASASMNKAAVAAKAEAERRAKEAAFTRKRAKEALEHVAYLVMKEKLRKKELALATPGEIVGPGLGGVGTNTNVGYPVSGLSCVKMERENNVNVSSGNRNGNVASGPNLSVVVEEKINITRNVDRVDNSNHVLAALNAVELSENDKTSGISAQNLGSGLPLNDDHAVMDVDEKVRMRVSGGQVGGLVGDGNNGSGNDHGIFADVEIVADNLNAHGEKPDDVNNEVVLGHTPVDPMQYKESTNGEEQHANGGSV